MSSPARCCALAFAMLLALLVFSPADAVPAMQRLSSATGGLVAALRREAVRAVVAKDEEEEKEVVEPEDKEEEKVAPKKKQAKVVEPEEGAEEDVVPTTKKKAKVLEEDEDEEVAEDDEEEDDDDDNVVTAKKKTKKPTAKERAKAKAEADDKLEALLVDEDEDGKPKRGVGKPKTKPTPKPRPLILDERESDITGNVFTAASAGDGEQKDKACFPNDASVVVEGQGTVAMRDLNVGDRVLVADGAYSEVFMFTHRLLDGVRTFVRIEVASGNVLRASPGHYLPVEGKGLVAAGEVGVRDVVRLGNGELAAVVDVSDVKGVGLFNPQTVDGELVVGGIVASCYTTAVDPSFAHGVLAPLRAVWKTLGWSLASLEEGGKGLEGLVAGGGRVEL